MRKITSVVSYNNTSRRFIEKPKTQSLVLSKSAPNEKTAAALKSEKPNLVKTESANANNTNNRDGYNLIQKSDDSSQTKFHSAKSLPNGKIF